MLVLLRSIILMKNEKGARAIELALVASLFVVAAVAAISALGGEVRSILTNAATIFG